MCEYPCFCPKIEKKYRALTLTLLDCWQREYDKRPYRCFQFKRLDLEKRFDRDFDEEKDFPVIVEFIKTRQLDSIEIVGISLMKINTARIYDFVNSLRNLNQIKLKLMDLPLEFFQLLANNAENLKMTKLNFKETPLNDAALDYLYDFILKTKTLQILHISSCSINQYNFARIADAIHKSTSLRSINISHLLGIHLAIDSEKIAHTISSLIWQNKLQELKLESCGLLGHDMETIAEYLYRKSSKLHTLSVSYNKIGANGALEIFKAITKSKTMKHLRMNGCGLGTHGGEIVSKYLSSSWNLQSLSFQYNQIEAEAINMILLTLKKSCKLQRLYFFGNKFNVRSGDILRRLLDSGVVPPECIDVTVTFDDPLGFHRVIPFVCRLDWLVEKVF